MPIIVCRKPPAGAAGGVAAGVGGGAAWGGAAGGAMPIIVPRKRLSGWGGEKPTIVCLKEASGLPQLAHPVASGGFRVPQCGHSLILRTITPDAPPLPRALAQP